MHYVYILKSKKDNRLYTGETADLRKRLDEHNAGKVKSTKSYRLWKLVYYEVHQTKILAKRAERFYKTSQGRRQVKKKLGTE